MSTKDLFIVMLAGGSGTHFWPLSREQFPKQFLPVFGGRSMFSMTAERSLELVPGRQLLIVTISSQMPEVRSALFEAGI